MLLVTGGEHTDTRKAVLFNRVFTQLFELTEEDGGRAGRWRYFSQLFT